MRSPRTFRALDVQNACRNLDLKADPKTPLFVKAVADFLLAEFFALSHGSGLYNRQIKLWEALAKTLTVEVYQQSKGIINNTKLPEYDFAFLDHKRRLLFLAHLNMPAQGLDFDYLKSAREFLKRASSNQNLAGVFLCYPSPFPPKVLEFIRRETNAQNSLSHYESVIPKLGFTTNLLQIDRLPVFNPQTNSEEFKIHLVHPDLSRKKSAAPQNIPAADLNSLD
ncbi:MAG: hypothetical protein K2X27_17375 [Candidatus Obscuribacterales bacterium]|nr:hypothetical protein [Candidatus Obscuribacterales bacterium]